MMGDKNSRVQGRYGLRGVRVGEASNPGPSLMSTSADSSMGLRTRWSSI